MKKTIAAVLLLSLSILLLGCGTEAPDATEPEATAASTEPTAQYGAMQEIVDTYGFPIHFRMTEGMELTKIVIYEDTAEREWMSSLDGSTLDEDLSWCINENILTIYGQWEDVFTINIDAGRAVSQADGKEYRIVTYDADGEVAYFVE